MKFFTASLLAIAMADNTPAASGDKAEQEPAAKMGMCTKDCEDGQSCTIKNETENNACPKKDSAELNCTVDNLQTLKTEEAEKKCTEKAGCLFTPKVAEVVEDNTKTPAVVGKPAEDAKCEKNPKLETKECECTSSSASHLAVVGVTAMVALLI